MCLAEFAATYVVNYNMVRQMGKNPLVHARFSLRANAINPP